MSLEQYNRLKVIGKGSYGEVWLAKHKGDKKQYVLKKMDLRKASKRERKAAEQEAQLLRDLKHPNIVSYKESFEADDGFLYIAMGYCEGGDLYGRLKEQNGKFLDERQVVEWFVQIAMALQYMHERKIMHRDLKTQNIFLTKSRVIKVGDLGIARVLDNSSDMASTMIGTPYYMSPEIFSNKPYNFKSDVWALGCCVYEMTTLKHAFNGKDMNSLMYKILRGKMPPMPNVYRVELVNLIKAMLNKSPEKRPTINRILRDPYIKENIAVFLEGSRPSSAGPRRPSTGNSVGQQLQQDSNRSPKKKSKSPAVAENLEPLNFGPDLEPIKEEPTPRFTDSVDSGIVSYASRDSRQSIASNADAQVTSQSSKNSTAVSRSQERRQRRSDLASSPSSRSSHASQSEPSASPSSPSPKSSVPAVHSEPNLIGRARQSDKAFDFDIGGSEDAQNTRQKNVIDKKPPARARVQDSGKGDNRLDGFIDEKLYQNVPRQLVSPRVLPPRPSVGDNPKVSRVRPSSGSPTEAEQSQNARQSAQYKSSSSSNSSADGITKSNSTPKLSSGVSQSVDVDASTRKSSARERRRQKVSSSCNIDAQLTSNGYAPQDASTVSKSYQLDVVTSADSLPPMKQVVNNGHGDIARSKSDPVLPNNRPPRIARLVEADQDVSSSSTSSTELDMNRRNETDMSELIELLNTTLHKPPKKFKKERGSRQDGIAAAAAQKLSLNATYVVKSSAKNVEMLPEPEYEIALSAADPGSDIFGIEEPEHPPFDSGISITTGGRLWDRISFLHRDIVQGLGVEKLKAAYDILDHAIASEEIEPKLIELLGRINFEEYAGKIFQLKFYEETAFGCNHKSQLV